MFGEKTLPLYPLALVAELADAPDLGSGVSRREGSSPFRRTLFRQGEIPVGISPFLVDFHLPIEGFTQPKL